MSRKGTKEKVEPAAEGGKLPAPPMVTVLKTAQARKLSPRGMGELTYQLGRRGDTLLLRISANESSGRFSREWVAADAIRKALAKAPKGAASFKAAVLLRAAWKGKSSCNGGFGAAALVAERVLEPDAGKRGMQKLTSPKALDDWEERVLSEPVPEGAEQVPLHPPKPKPFFAKKAESEGAEEAAETEAGGPPPEGEGEP